MDLRTVDRSAEKALSEPLLEHSRDEETPNGPVVVPGESHEQNTIRLLLTSSSSGCSEKLNFKKKAFVHHRRTHTPPVEKNYFFFM